MKTGLCALWLAAATMAWTAEGIRRPEDDPAQLSQRSSGAAYLDSWMHPVYPPELKSTHAEAYVRVRYIVDETGAIVSPEVLSGDERFHAAALAAIRQWKYKLEGKGGRTARWSYEVVFSFRPSGPPKSASRFSPPYPIEASPLRPPQEKEAPDPGYPKHLITRQFFGEVELILGVNKEGRVKGVEVLRSTHADLLAEGFSTVEHWTFQPAMRGLVPVDSEKRAVLAFKVEEAETGNMVRNDWMEKNGISLRDPNAPKPARYFADVPKAEVFVDPIYPDELLQNGTEGTARVDFSVDREGKTSAITIFDASHPDFGQTLASAVAHWKFEPLFREGESVWADFSVRWNFVRPAASNTAPEMLSALNSQGNRANAKQLDRPLKPLFLRPVVSPEAGPNDSAEIEVTINRAGRVCWPKVIRASSPAYGWAAATSVSQWYFETPLKGGHPVDVRVIIPVSQAAP